MCRLRKPPVCTHSSVPGVRYTAPGCVDTVANCPTHPVSLGVLIL